MGDGLDYWDRPEYPRCRDKDCTAAQAGIPHVLDEAHREAVDAQKQVRAMRVSWPEHSGTHVPRNLFLKAALKQRARRERRVWWLLVAGPWILAGIWLALIIACGLVWGW